MKIGMLIGGLAVAGLALGHSHLPKAWNLVQNTLQRIVDRAESDDDRVRNAERALAADQQKLVEDTTELERLRGMLKERAAEVKRLEEQDAQLKADGELLDMALAKAAEAEANVVRLGDRVWQVTDLLAEQDKRRALAPQVAEALQEGRATVAELSAAIEQAGQHIEQRRLMLAKAKDELAVMVATLAAQAQRAQVAQAMADLKSRGGTGEGFAGAVGAIKRATDGHRAKADALVTLNPPEIKPNAALSAALKKEAGAGKPGPAEKSAEKPVSLSSR